MAANEEPPKTHQQKLSKFWQTYRWSLAIALFVGFLIGFLFIPLWELLRTNPKSFVESLIPEAIGIGFTVLFIDVLYRRREEKSRIKDLKEQLVRDASSLVNDVAVNAVHQMRKREWLCGDDGLLKGSDLIGANLEGASLWEANLEGVDFRGTNLDDADLRAANLKGADLGAANLKSADLNNANLKEARLASASLEGANLFNANLEGVDMQYAIFGENTTLPDGNKCTPDTDMNHFTDPQYLGFWRSDDDCSPAYRGKGKV